MTVHDFVRELIRFEEQRLSTQIACPNEAEHDPPTTSVVVRLPHPDAPRQLAIITGDEDRCWPYPIAQIPTGAPVCVDSQDGPIAVASVDENLVRLAFDPNALARESDRALLARLWDHAVVAALEQAARHARETADTGQVEAFARLEERWHRETLARLPGAIENNEYSLTRLESQMRDLVQKTDDIRRQERALQLVAHASLRDLARHQWAALRRLVPETYRVIELRGTTLVALTYEVVIEHDEMSFDIGEFEVDVDVVAGTFTITNRTNPRQNVQHPHVRSASEPCTGNLHAGLTRLLAEREWAGLLTVLHRFIHSYNERDAYLKVEAWGQDHEETDDEDYDDDDSDNETVECSLCAEHVDSSEITDVQDEPVCMACYERDTMVCVGCSTRILSRNVVRESFRCRTCMPLSPEPTVQEVTA